MKKFISLALTALLLAGSMITAVSAAPDKGSYGEVPLYKGGITIDGEMDEAYSLGLKIDCSIDYSDAYATDTTCDLYLLHDGTYLYLLYDVKSANDIDPANYNPANADASNAWKSSGTELFIDWANTGAQAKLHGWIDGQMWGGAATLCEGAEATYVADYKTTYDVAAKTYKMEWKLPMLEGATIGSDVGFYVMVTSNTDMFNGAQETICCTAPGLANQWAEFPCFTISGTEVALPEVVTDVAVEEPAAPQTFDAGVIAAVAAVISAAGYAISKKR